MEANNQKVSARIQHAECAILDRARALLNSPGDSLREGQALDDALYALRALKSCLELHGGFATVEWQGGRPNLRRSDRSLLA